MTERNYIRLSDKVLDALQLALDQGDIDIAELLNSALEMAATRAAGGANFVERRDFDDKIEKAMEQLNALRHKAHS